VTTGKRFRLAAEAIRPIATGLGACIASDRITVDGAPVGYCYREAPDDAHDSGWRFMAGDEGEDYDASQFGIYDVNTIANYDPAIVPLLGNAAPVAFVRGAGDAFAREPFEPPHD
jgi:hypothetical protein